MKRVYIFVNGIMTWPGSSKNWNGRAVTWIHTHTQQHTVAEKIEYFVSPIGRPFRQKKRAQKLARTLSFYQDWEIVLVGHSNGCDVIADALALAGQPPVKAIHLFSAACKADFSKNGFNAVTTNQIHIYIATKDRALRLAGTKIGRLLGYGVLGKKGPVNQRPGLVTNTTRRPYKHSGWWAPGRFNLTMAAITTH